MPFNNVPMSNLAEALTQLVWSKDHHHIDAPAAWSQGRTLYGGMTAALCYQAAVRQFPVASPLLSAQFLFAGPASGELALRAEILREGRSSTILAVDCLSEAGLAARASFAFGAARESLIQRPAAARPVPAPAPEDCPIFIERTGGFHDNFELSLAEGSPLCSGGPSDFAVWTRFRDPLDVGSASGLLALADTLPPAAMASFPSPAPISTFTWSLDFAAIPDQLDGWYLLRASSEQSLGGYSIQNMEVADRSGAPLAFARQMIAIFI